MKLERLCHYISRPAISEQRLCMTKQGQVWYELKTHALVIEGEMLPVYKELIKRLDICTKQTIDLGVLTSTV